MKKLELLAPAGDMECLKTAFKFGADAVYIGGPFMQLRSKVTGFTIEDIAEAVKYAHSLNKKLYVTVNSFAKDQEFKEIVEYGRKLKDINVDAVIVSDLGVISVLRSQVPDLEIHVSTQANCQNAFAAKVYYDLGVKRIVIAREMNLEEIKNFSKIIPADLEIEAFVHGAMCMAYSGRCFISTYLTNRSGNRGECTQPCRWRYHLVEQTRPNEFFPIEEGEKGTTLLSSRDMKCIDFLDELIDAGVTSFKIEGRMKSPYYVATVVNAYRHAIDKTAPTELLSKELDAVSHRPYSSGFYFGELERYMPDDDMAYKQDKVFAGIVKKCENGKLTIEQRNYFKEGDVFEVISTKSIGLNFEVKNLYNSNNEKVDTAPHPQELVTMDCPFNLEEGDILRKR
ncbi:MAG: U32 family peptidase [Clostridiales bacterium]|nr:U32 family peptidase [Clostridiales bacterium]